MALQSSGPISLGDVQGEFGGSNPISLSEYYGAAAGVPGSGAISLSDFYGTSSIFTFTISGNRTNLDLRTEAVNLGWDQSTPVECTIASGVVISGNTQGDSTAALTISGSFPNGVTLFNNGSIRGRGGNGGRGGNTGGAGVGGSKGGRALRVTVAVSIDNQGTIGAGGGGGGGGGYYLTRVGNGGGGGGGGRSSNVNSSGGAGGSSTNTGGAGGSGTLNSAGSGGAGGPGNDGGNGGGIGANGFNGVSATQPGGNGGAKGQAVNGNSNITWISTGTRLGSII